MKKLLLILSLAMPVICCAQKMYVWCPENNQIKAREGLKSTDTVNVVFFDGRSIPKKNKIECTFEQFSQSLFTQLKSAYPNVIFVLQPEAEYYKKSVSEHNLIVKVGVSSYQAAFGTDISGGVGIVGGSFSTMVFPKGKWNALTAFHVQVLGKTGTVNKDFASVSSKSNMWGYKSARSALNETYNETTGELLFFIDDQLSN